MSGYCFRASSFFSLDLEHLVCPSQRVIFIFNVQIIYPLRKFLIKLSGRQNSAHLATTMSHNLCGTRNCDWVWQEHNKSKLWDAKQYRSAQDLLMNL